MLALFSRLWPFVGLERLTKKKLKEEGYIGSKREFIEGKKREKKKKKMEKKFIILFLPLD